MSTIDELRPTSATAGSQNSNGFLKAAAGGEKAGTVAKLSGSRAPGWGDVKEKLSPKLLDESPPLIGKMHK
jgi:hypothetical protein